MTHRSVDPARLPPTDLDGLDPAWSRLVEVPSTDGAGRTWHLLDNGVVLPRTTLLCVHGNPSWSYLWRRLLAAAPAGGDVRVLAVDQLGMGYSERTRHARSLATRVDDLCELTDELNLSGPVVTVAHDWGGPVALGWAQRHIDQLDGVVLLNTAVHQPPGSPAPSLIRMVRKKALLEKVTVATSAFIDGALAMSRPRPSPQIRRAFHAPYETPDRRRAIGDFVADIPLDPEHESAACLDDIAAGMDSLAKVPALLLWGPQDRVFSDLYLHDLEQRLPHADVHRFPGASHFVSEDVDYSSAVFDWLAPRHLEIAAERDRLAPVWDGLGQGRPGSGRPAVIEMGPGRPEVSFGELHRRVERVAAWLGRQAIEPGDRVALMIPPSIDLTVCVYACWKAGATIVLIDSGLGPRGMSRAFASAAPDHVIAIPKALVAAKALRWPGRRFSTTRLRPSERRALGVLNDLESSIHGDGDRNDPTFEPDDDAVAAVVFTSGSTGPSKGVVYRHHQLQAQRDALMDLYGVTQEDRLVAAFAPFALYGPAMGVGSVVPDMDVTAPGTLTADALGDAASAIDATLVFASPAALVNVVKTQDALTPNHHEAFAKVRLVMSAGAPVRASLLREVARLFPNAEAHTPYGMTEMIPVANIALHELDGLSRVVGGDGVCVGHPLPGVDVQISALDSGGLASPEPTTEPGITGEVLVKAAHARDGYDRLWHTEHLASQPTGWHRTGDVGHLDDDGRLWIGGRLGHVIVTADGPLTPVAIEQSIELVAEVEAAAVVGVGPIGTQQVVAVVELAGSAGVRRPRLAGLELHDEVRAAANRDVAAVLVVRRLPVDRRHNSKIDRTRIADWAERVLAGGRMGRL